MKDDIYNKRGKAPNNFPKHLTPQLAGLAQQVVKENYNFGFATVSHETYDESELENALHENITDLLLELGNGFAFLGYHWGLAPVIAWPRDSLVERYGIGRGEDAIGLRSEVRKISILFIISRNYYQSNYSDCYRD